MVRDQDNLRIGASQDWAVVCDDRQPAVSRESIGDAAYEELLRHQQWMRDHGYLGVEVTLMPGLK